MGRHVPRRLIPEGNVCHLHWNHERHELLVILRSHAYIVLGSVFVYRRRFYNYTKLSVTVCGPGSSVGIATDYGLEGPGSNPGGDEIFRPSRPALEPTQPPVK